MTNTERAREIINCRKQMKKLTHEFMLTKDFTIANEKLDELNKLSTKVSILKQEQKENSFISKLKQKLGLH